MDQCSRSRISIVIVNWNSGPLLSRCLGSMSVCRDLDRVARVVVVDNDSQDGSCDHLPTISVPVTVVRNDTNRGFAAACNEGAALCQSEYLLFLNPDSELLENSLTGPLEYLDDPKNRNVEICGIQLLDERGRVARSCSRLPTCYSLVTTSLRLHGISRKLFPPHFMKEWDHLETRFVEQVIGAFFVIRSDLFQQLKGFDERFFVYFEEVDICERARQLGRQTVFLTTSQALHIGAGCTHQIRGRSLFYSLRSRLAYADKHFRGWRSRLIKTCTMIVEPTIRISFALLKLKWVNVTQLMFAFGKLWQSSLAASPWRACPFPQNPVPFRRITVTEPGHSQKRAA